MRVEGAGVALAYEEEGGGPATVLVHGMGAPRLRVPGLGRRVVTYDRRGYGESGTPEQYVRATVAEHAEDLAALLRGIDAAPAVLVGEDFGALVALDVAVRHPGLLRGAVLVDPPVYWFVAEATSVLSEQHAGLERVVRDEGPEAAVRWWRRDAPAGSARGFFADFGALTTLEHPRSVLRAIAAPVAVVSSQDARPHDRAAADALLAVLPTATRHEDVAEAVRGVGP
jgi:pimeloyl-ACP methyl ester carboxylesterase